MNKKQLANLIWNYCNEVRNSSIDVMDYKDIILGLIFYKFLSSNLVKFLKLNYFEDEDIKEELNNRNTKLIESLMKEKGYFIEYNDLFSTWIEKIDELTWDDVYLSFKHFDKNIGPEYIAVYGDIFESLLSKLGNLGKTQKEQIQHIKKIILIINQIPTDDMNKNYDVLGYVYEFLIGEFNLLSGKGGEFYTPKEISIIMSDIASHHLKERQNIQIYDPTSGSGSLLINIGESIKKHSNFNINVEYFAQELMQSTYNITRMNLLMKGIKPQNIQVRNDNTLLNDWPFLDELVQVDCVVANPPYSVNWNPDDHISDKRFDDYGLAPRKYADYAFLLHCLYHMKKDGIMQIVLPHGVLFRMSREYEIRKNLIEKNNIYAVIGLPSNIFANTKMPTCILILKKDNDSDSIQFIDASKEFVKDGKINVLQGSNIKKIVDTVISRSDIPFFSRVVCKQEIVNNDYNLNISKYISSEKPTIGYDLYSIIHGGIPNSEIDMFNEYWELFPNLRNEIFKNVNDHSSFIINENIYETIVNNELIKYYKQDASQKFEKFKNILVNEIIEHNTTNPYFIKEKLTEKLFEICSEIKLLDKYNIFNAFDEHYKMIIDDLEVLNECGIDIIKQYEEKQLSNKKWIDGKIIPLDLIIKKYFRNDLEKIKNFNNDIENIDEEIQRLIDSIDFDKKNSFWDDETQKINENNLKTIIKEIEKDRIENELDDLKILKIYELLQSKKRIKKDIKVTNENIDSKAINKLSNLDDQEVKNVLQIKWINPIIENIDKTIFDLIETFAFKINELVEKYNNPLIQLEKEIKSEEQKLINCLNELFSDDDYDNQAIKSIIKIFGGN